MRLRTGWITLLERAHSLMVSRAVPRAECVIVLPLAAQVPLVRQLWLTHLGSPCPQVFSLDELLHLGLKDEAGSSTNSARAGHVFNPAAIGTLLWQARLRLRALPDNARAALGKPERLAPHLVRLVLSLVPTLRGLPVSERPAWLERARQALFEPTSWASSEAEATLAANVEVLAQWQVLEQGLQLLALDWLDGLALDSDSPAVWDCWSAAPLLIMLDDSAAPSASPGLMQALARRHWQRTVLWRWEDFAQDDATKALLPGTAIAAQNPEQEMLAVLQWLQTQVHHARTLAHSRAYAIALVCEDPVFCTQLEHQLAARGLCLQRSRQHSAPLAQYTCLRQLLTLLQAAAHDADPEAILAAIDILDPALSIAVEAQWRRLQWQTAHIRQHSAWEQLRRLTLSTPQQQQAWHGLVAQLHALQPPRSGRAWQQSLLQCCQDLCRANPDSASNHNLGAAWPGLIDTHFCLTSDNSTAPTRHSLREVSHWLQQCLASPGTLGEHELAHAPTPSIHLLSLAEAAALLGPLHGSAAPDQTSHCPQTRTATPCGLAFDSILIAACDAQHMPIVAPHAAPFAVIGSANAPWPKHAVSTLGLASLSARRTARLATWQRLLAYPNLTVTWSQLNQDRALGPSPLVQLTQLQQPGRLTAVAASTFVQQHQLQTRPVERPAPIAAQWAIPALSATSVQWLRACPYRFFIQHLLQLRQHDDLQRAFDARDRGNLLHRLLWLYQQHRPNFADDQAGLDHALGLLQSQWRLSAIDLFDLHCLWPDFRAAFLAWQRQHEHVGWRFSAGEQSVRVQVGQAPKLTLKGTIDRIDARAASTNNPATVHILDYKSGGGLKIDPEEEVQLAFYAALLRCEQQFNVPVVPPRNDPLPSPTPPRTLGLGPTCASYLSLRPEKERNNKNYLPEKRLTQLHLDLADVWGARLLEGLQQDMQALQAGHSLGAFSAYPSCKHCPAGGLCRVAAGQN